MKRVSSTAAPAAPAAPARVAGPTSCTLPKKSKRRVLCQEAKGGESVNLLRKRNRVSLQDLAAASPPDKHAEAAPAPSKRAKGTAPASCSTTSTRLQRLARLSSPTPEERIFVVLSQESTPEKAEKAPAEPLRGMPEKMGQGAQGQERPGACLPWPRPQSLRADFDFEQASPTSFRPCSSGEVGLELSWQLEVGEGFEAGYESALCDEQNGGDMQARAGELLNEERARLLQQQQLSMRFDAGSFDGEWSSAYNDGYMERMKELSCTAPHGAHEGAFTHWPEPDGNGIAAFSSAVANSQAREQGLAEGFETGYTLALDHLHASLKREGFDVSCLQAPDSSSEFREGFKEGFGKGYSEALVDMQVAETCRGVLLCDP